MRYIEKEQYRLLRFTGGEPLLHKDIGVFIAMVNQIGCKTSIITNGFLLLEKYKELCENGLNQIIVSLDGDNAEIHNEIRNTKKLFERAVEGIKRIKIEYPNVIIRVNTVVSKYNFYRLTKVYNLLQTLGVEQWSIIPIKAEGGYWADIDFNIFLNEIEYFQSCLKEESPYLLGYSQKWAGRTMDEIYKYYTYGRTFTPKKKCNLVKELNFYNPFKEEVLPCNCIVHRLKDYRDNLYGLEKFDESAVEWLYYNAPKICNGCEPVNAYVSENPEVLRRDIFEF